MDGGIVKAHNKELTMAHNVSMVVSKANPLASCVVRVRMRFLREYPANTKWTAMPHSRRTALFSEHMVGHISHTTFNYIRAAAFTTTQTHFKYNSVQLIKTKT